jgi:pyroglutamyl-peptidase
MKVLVAGFEKWGPYKTNPSQEIAKRLNGKIIAGANIIGISLPVNFSKLPSTLNDSIKKYKPNILITLGLSFRHLDNISIETIARRKIKPHFPDNQGKWPNNAKNEAEYDLAEEEKAPMFRRTTLPVNKIKLKLISANIPVMVSRNAGGHMCEQCLYLGGYFMEKNGLNGISGHIHMPHSPSAARDVKSKKFMNLNKIQKGVEIAIEESVKFLKKK